MFNKKLIYIVGIILFTLVGCSNNDNITLSEHEKKAIDYLKSNNYIIVSHLESSYEYVLNKEMITMNPYNRIWAVQYTEPDLYFNKLISIYSFIVENHPLVEVLLAMGIDYDNYDVQVNVFISEEEAIGGTSNLIPKDNSLLFGGAYSIDGKTLEEVTGLTYDQWTEAWRKKYGH